MKREWPFLALEVVLLLVLLQSNAPEVWFWFIALLVLLMLIASRNDVARFLLE